MKSDIIIAGVGGQGIISIAASIGMAALQDNLNMKQAEVHGMSQRGGAVQSHLRLSSQLIFSDLVPRGGADLVISVEPMESLRYIEYLSPTGWVVTNITPFVNIPNYPDVDALMQEINKLPRHIAIDADKIAKEVASAKSSNMVMLGAASVFIDIPQQNFEQGIHNIFVSKGQDVVDSNILAFRKGREFALEHK